MITLQAVPATVSRNYDVLREGKVVGASIVTRTLAADRSGREMTRTALRVGEAEVRMEAVAFLAVGGSLRREVQDVFFSKDIGRGKHLQTIAEFDAAGATVTVTEKGVRKVSEAAAPKGLPRGNPWRFGMPAAGAKADSTFRYAEFDLTAVRWKQMTATYSGRRGGAYALELAEGARSDKVTVDRAGMILTLTSSGGYSLRPRSTPQATHD